MSNAYKDIGPNDEEVIAVAWEASDNLRPVVPMTFETWTIDAEHAHGVRFTDGQTGARIVGSADDVFGLAWIDDGAVRTAFRVTKMLTDARDDLLAFAVFPLEHWRKIWSTNPLERLHREVKRRCDVVGVFPKRCRHRPTRHRRDRGSPRRMASHRPALPLRDLHGSTPPDRLCRASDARAHQTPTCRLNPVSVGEKPALPYLDLARIHRYCDMRFPALMRDETRVEARHRGKSVTIYHCRPPWHPDLPESSRVPVAQLRYDPAQHHWTLYYADQYRWHPYDLIEPGTVDELLEEIGDDPTGTFWG